MFFYATGEEVKTGGHVLWDHMHGIVEFIVEPNTYTHDGLGRIETIDKDSTGIASYSYMGQNTQSVLYPEPNVIQSWGYDELGRVEQVHSAEGDNQTILDFIYTYDNAGNRNSVKYNHLTTPKYDKYYYNTLNQLWKAEYGQSSGFSRMIDGGRRTIDDLVLLASAWLETTDYADKYKNIISGNLCQSVAKNYSTAEIAQIKRQIDYVPTIVEGS